MSSKWSLPPPGYKPGQTRAPLVTDIVVPLAIVAISLACVRFYVRARLVRSFGKDDWLLVAAVFFLCVVVGSSLWGIKEGNGMHFYDQIRQGIDIKSSLPVCSSSLR